LLVEMVLAASRSQYSYYKTREEQPKLVPQLWMIVSLMIKILAACDFTSGTYLKNTNTTIRWVSTESHLGTVGTDTTAVNRERPKTAWDVITHTSSNGDRTPY
jgi:hypothetical protein